MERSEIAKLKGLVEAVRQSVVGEISLTPAHGRRQTFSFAACYARATSGHTAAALPSGVMNSPVLDDLGQRGLRCADAEPTARLSPVLSWDRSWISQIT
jgi:hypothetical protein